MCTDCFDEIVNCQNIGTLVDADEYFIPTAFYWFASPHQYRAPHRVPRSTAVSINSPISTPPDRVAGNGRRQQCLATVVKILRTSPFDCCLRLRAAGVKLLKSDETLIGTIDAPIHQYRSDEPMKVAVAAAVAATVPAEVCD